MEQQIAHSELLNEWFARLKDQNPERRAATLEMVCDLEPAELRLPLFRAALKDEDGTVRSTAAWALGEQGMAAEAALPELVDALSDSDGTVRYWAIEAIEGIDGCRSPTTIRSLVALLEDPHPRVRWKASGALSRLTTDKLHEALLWLQRNPHHPISHMMEVLFYPILPNPVQRLWNAMRETPPVRRAAVLALKHIGSSARSLLLAALGDPDADVRASALRAIGSFAPKDWTEVLELSYRLLSDPSEFVRLEAVETVKCCAHDHKCEAVSALTARLNDENAAVRSATISALLVLLPEANHAFLSILRCLTDADEHVRTVAGIASHYLTPTSQDRESAIEMLLQLLADRSVSEDARCDAISAIGRLGADPLLVSSKLAPCIGDPSATIRFHVAGALRETHSMDEGVQKLLLKHLNDTDPRVRLTCAQALGVVHAPAQDALLARLSVEADFECRFWAAWALARINPHSSEAVLVLIQALTYTNPQVRLSAAETLGQLGTSGFGALSALEKALDDEDHELRREVELAIRRIKSQSRSCAPSHRVE